MNVVNLISVPQIISIIGLCIALIFIIIICVRYYLNNRK